MVIDCFIFSLFYFYPIFPDAFIVKAAYNKTKNNKTKVFIVGVVKALKGLEKQRKVKVNHGIILKAHIFIFMHLLKVRKKNTLDGPPVGPNSNDGECWSPCRLPSAIEGGPLWIDLIAGQGHNGEEDALLGT